MKKKKQMTSALLGTVLIAATVFGPTSAFAQEAEHAYLPLGQYFSAIQKMVCEESDEKSTLDILRGQELALYSFSFSTYIKETNDETKKMVRNFRTGISSMRSSLETDRLGGGHLFENVRNEFCTTKFE